MTAPARKWIDQELASLDPDTDYVRIWQLVSAYHVNRFQLSFFFAYSFPLFQMTPRQARTVYRDGRGQMVTTPEQRFWAQNEHMFTWWQYGPLHEKTRESADRVNRVHAAIAKSYPGAFSFQPEYIYALCVLGAAGHLIEVQVGLPGFDEKVKRASYRYWTEMARLFRSEGDTPLEGWPADFEGMVAFIEEYESGTFSYHPEGAATLEGAVRQFAELNFPRPLHPVARAMVLSMYPDHIISTFRLKRPTFVVRSTVRMLFRVMFLSTRFRRDPATTIWERRERAVTQAATAAA
jgi:hypothetical protein